MQRLVLFLGDFIASNKGGCKEFVVRFVIRFRFTCYLFNIFMIYIRDKYPFELAFLLGLSIRLGTFSITS